MGGFNMTQDLMSPKPLAWGYTLNDALKWFRDKTAKAKNATECLQARALVAAAPELLEALESLLAASQKNEGSLDDEADVFEAEQKATAAINKARGLL